MVEVEEHPGKRRLIEHLGKPWVFWPAMLGGGVLVNGPSDPWPNIWLWALTSLLLGPVLAAVLWSLQVRSERRRPPG